ncbi:diiron oxygenase [Cytobacillus oceanisediminis]|uniref:diiron oxygenase n=1 Tax=Cytobacillus oceanisediminis TaxID=665099 RepID=UPI001C234EAB|nr:diiron oxygenase [Cytobacillus oceanisediminis]MBU8772069.1 diiron oxygenase [Cytobacillus oceanisediminis]
MQNFSSLKPIIDKIIHLSESTYYNPFTSFEWPDSIEDGQLWMSKELITMYNSEEMEELDEQKIYELSKWESINFYSLNVHGIRELLIDMLYLVHRKGYEEPSRYFHYFIGEENEHMYFFSKFCLKYGKKIYARKKVDFGTNEETDIMNFMLFIKILVFEELVDYYNQTMARDENLPAIIREINRIHHQDESRHISFNRAMVKTLFDEIREKYPVEKIEKIRNYVKEYLYWSISEFYNPTVYRDVGLKHPITLRKKLLSSPSSKERHKKSTKKLGSFLKKNNILIDDLF